MTHTDKQKYLIIPKYMGKYKNEALLKMLSIEAMQKQIDDIQKGIIKEKERFVSEFSLVSIGDKLEYVCVLNHGGHHKEYKECIVITNIEFKMNSQTGNPDILYIGKRPNKDGITVSKRKSFEVKIWHNFLMMKHVVWNASTVLPVNITT